MTLRHTIGGFEPGVDCVDADRSSRTGLDLLVTGAVQGVGFRPFIARLARRHKLAGTVRNTLEGVRIEVEGPQTAVSAFVERIGSGAPAAARIARIERSECAPRGQIGFTIAPSEATGTPTSQIVADLATCPACLAEILDPRNRRYRYPFTNCTHCGPRYTILQRLPYDRANTSMARFAMCSACRSEYEDMTDRRYHAQPIACPDCGPQVWLQDHGGKTLAQRDDALTTTVRILRQGGIVAVQGLGGFHLLVDARHGDGVARLRARKQRPHKPFAVMAPDIRLMPGGCALSPIESALLASPQAPIVLLTRSGSADGYMDGVAPDCPTVGVMLPYTPLHHILMHDFGGPVVATSGNVSDEPICTVAEEAVARLRGFADAFLVHDRPILRPVDDSVARIVNGTPMLLRRARGYAPMPISAEGVAPGIEAVGGHQKNTVGVTRQNHVFVSQHLGDLSSPDAADLFRRTTAELPALLNVAIGEVVADRHLDYGSSQYARESGEPWIEVQHHYAHGLSCMAEHGLEGPVLAVVCDGTGYGSDGTSWGGEFLVADRREFTRVAHLRPFRLPGNAKAIHEPRRCGLGVLWELFGRNLPEELVTGAFDATELDALISMLSGNVNAPVTTSMGRLFDALASLLRICQCASFEGQAPMALEALAGSTTEGRQYQFGMLEQDPVVVDWAPVILEAMEDIRGGSPLAAIALGFHEALAQAVAGVAGRVGLEEVVLSGGCFQNRLLAELTLSALERTGCRAYSHCRVPPNDGGLALGQAYYRGGRLRSQEFESCV